MGDASSQSSMELTDGMEAQTVVGRGTFHSTNSSMDDGTSHGTSHYHSLFNPTPPVPPRPSTTFFQGQDFSFTDYTRSDRRSSVPCVDASGVVSLARPSTVANCVEFSPPGTVRSQERSFSRASSTFRLTQNALPFARYLPDDQMSNSSIVIPASQPLDSSNISSSVTLVGSRAPSAVNPPAYVAPVQPFVPSQPVIQEETYYNVPTDNITVTQGTCQVFPQPSYSVVPSFNFPRHPGVSGGGFTNQTAPSYTGMQQSHSVPAPQYHHPSPSRPQTIATVGWLLPPPDAHSTPPPQQYGARRDPILVPQPLINKIPFGDNPFVGLLHTDGGSQFQPPPPPVPPPIPPAPPPAPPVPPPQQYYYGPLQPQVIYLQAPAQQEKVPKKPPLDSIRILSTPSDFHVWHMELQRVCIDHGLWPHIAPHPQNGAAYVEGLWPSYMPQNPAEQPYWWKVDGVMSSMLVERLSPSIRGLVPFSTAVSRVTSREIYEWILKHYGLNDYASFSALESDLLRTNCTKTSVQEYARNWLEKLFTICTSNYPTDERRLLNGFSVGLPVNDPNYAPLVAEIGSVINGNVYFDIAAYIAQAQSIDQRLQAQAQTRVAMGHASTTSSNRQTSKPAQTSAAKTAASPCTTCKATSHATADCFQPGGAMEGRASKVLERRKAERAAQRGASKVQPTQTANIVVPATTASTPPIPAVPQAVPPPPLPPSGGDLANTTSLMSAAVIPNATVFDLYPSFAFVSYHHEQAAFPSATYSVKEASSQFNMLLDSGCSSHMVRDRSLFWEFDDSNTSRVMVRTANCGEFVTRGRGTVKFEVRVGEKSITLCLRDCLYSPELPINLMSVGAVVEKGVDVIYSAGTCRLIFPKTHPELRGCTLHTTMVGRLAFMWCRFLPPSTLSLPIPVVEQLALPALPSPATWHRRCVHAGMEAVREMLTQDYVTSAAYKGKFPTEPCPSCVVGKRPQRPFDHHQHCVEDLLELIHVDVGGLFPVRTPDKKRYFIIFLDDADAQVAK